MNDVVYIKIMRCSEVFQELPTHEVARILRDLADRVEGHPHFSAGHYQNLMDVNGNNVGWVTVYAAD